jgi:hypothetical protein
VGCALRLDEQQVVSANAQRYEVDVLISAQLRYRECQLRTGVIRVQTGEYLERGLALGP